MSAGVLRPKAFLTSLILAASVALLVLLVLWSPQGARSQTTFTVTKTDDTADGVCDADCALREAVIAANALPGADTIEVPAGMYGLTIAGDDDTAAAGDLDITDNLTLAGGGAGSTIIDANGAGGVIQVIANFVTPITVNISGVTVREGSTFGIFADLSTVNLSDVKATASGNGIQLTRSTGSLANVTASGNSGAGINLARSSDFTVTKSTVNGNGSDGVLHDRTFDSSFTNVTISGNGGYGFENLAGTGDLTNLTIHGNAVGLYVIVTSPTLKNTIVAGSTGAANCQFDIGGSITSAGQNLASDDTCGLDGPGDQPNTDPLLGPLADNGGPTATHALLAGSPAIDAGSADCPPPATDQRGITRPLDGDGNGSAICDIGAFEVAPKFGVADDFSATANPSGCWSYGFRPLGGSFILYDQYGQFHVAGLDEWRLQSSENPIVAHNSSANAVTFSTLTVGAGQVIFHPGAQGQQSVIRFTAPFAGDFMIDRRDFQRCRQRWRRHRRARYQERDGFIRRQLERPGQRW